MAPNPIPLLIRKQENIPKTLPLGLGPTVHRVPVEILVQIFWFCLPLQGLSDPWDLTPSACRNQAPLSLCHVCSSWRRIAMETPALWISLAMEVSLEDTLVVPERHGQVASFWISQAGCRLVDLWITSRSTADDDFEKFSTNFMIQVVRPRAERIRSLHLSFNTIYDLLCLLQYQDHEDTLPHHVWSFPSLEYLIIDLYSFPSTARTMLTALQSMPKLHTVELSHVIVVNELIIQLPWAQLTSLTIYLIPESVFRVLMTQCPALETVHFSVRDRYFDEELLVVNVTLTRLTTFEVHFLGISGSSIFDGIHFPALNNLTLYLPYCIGEFTWTAPEHMFRHLAPITTLSLGGHIDPPNMIDILRQTKNVTTFKVEFGVGHGGVLKALTLDEDEEVLLPTLSVLHVQMCAHHCEPFAVVDFVEMVASRSPTGATPLDVTPLQEVWVGIPAYINTLKEELDAVLEQWGHKADMPRVQYEKP